MARSSYTTPILLLIIGGIAYLWYISTKPQTPPSPEAIPRDIIKAAESSLKAGGAPGDIIGSIAARLPGGGYFGPIEHFGITMTDPVLGPARAAYDIATWIKGQLRGVV